ncbi:MAG: Eco57I restriction-modification methylase domain-containing protein [Coleofasciculus sp. S288]|nr:Eco57I restriction-modification methylase domain-containing protein [Coleofasciculus sp. S288]
MRGSEGKPRYEYFRKALAEMAKHPNPRYFVLKSIMLNNLYGVDIMEEATEICKLRLFLKLVAQMEPQPKQPNFGLEPLPDIDFNIRAGNTLVGFASLDEVRKAIKQDGDQLKLDLQDDASRINEKAELADRAFQRFRQMQTEFGMDAGDFRTAKKELRRRLAELNDQLNHYLAREYGVDVNKPTAFEKWRDSHQPFHWFVEFYSIIHRGGFDVIIGNPPYVEYSKVKKIYSIKNYKTESCGNLYAYSLERAAAILRCGGKLGFIIPVASVCTDGYTSLQRMLREKGGITISNFNDRPSKLFDGLEHIRLTIILWKKQNETREIFTTKYNKWQSIERNSLFDCLTYSTCPDQFIIEGSIPKVHSSIEKGIFSKLVRQRKTIKYFLRQNGSHEIYYTRKLSGFVQILDFIPKIYDSTGESRYPSELKAIKFDTKTTRDVYLALLNSNLFYWFLTIYSDCRNLNKRELMMIPLDFEDMSESIASDLSGCCNQLMKDFYDNSKMLEMRYEKLGKMTIQCIYPKFSKPIIDEIDRVLARHYGFTDEELDFIINYDIKYRMGRDSGGDD